MGIEEAIIDIVAEHYNLHKTDLLGIRRNEDFVIPRHMCRFMLRYNTTMTLERIAEMMIGGKKKRNHHTTIVSSITVIKNLVTTDEQIEKDAIDIQSLINKEKMAIIKRMRMHKPGNTFLDKQEVRRKILVEQEKKAPVIRIETLSPADEVRRKYL